MRYPLQVFVRVLAVLALVVPGFVVTVTAVDAESGVQDELALGPETGFLFYWDPSLVSLVDQRSDPGFDSWTFQSDDATTEIWAYLDSEATLESCINDFLDDLADTSDIAEVAALPPFAGGPPQIIGNSAPIVITFDDGKKLAADVSCRAVTPGESVALAFVYMRAEDYNERVQASEVVGGREFSIQTSMYDAIDLFVDAGLTNPDATVVSIPSGDDNSGVEVLAFLPCNTAVFDLLVGGYGDSGTVTFDPDSLVAIDGTGAAHPVSAATWSLPQGRRGSVLELAHGEYGLVRGKAELPQLQDFELYVESPAGDLVYLTRSILGCGESGAAPVPIDID